MPYNCPHCSVAIEDAVSKDTMKERLAAKDRQISDYRDEAKEQRQRADGLEKQSTGWREAAERLAAIEARQAEDAAFTEAGLRADLTDRQRRILRSEYEHAAKDANGERPPLTEWLKAELSAEQVDPMLAALRAPSGDVTPAPPHAGVRPVAPRVPVDRSIGAPPPASVPRNDPGAIAARFDAWLKTAPKVDGAVDYSQMPPDLAQAMGR